MQAKIDDNKRCPICFNGTLHKFEKQQTFTYKGRDLTFLQPGEWCDNCDDGMLTGTDMLATEPLLINFRDEVDSN